jgi:mRNA interferase MazF
VIFDRFDTAVVPFPFAEVPVVKRRPVVILSGRAFNTDTGSSLVAMVTTSTVVTWAGDVQIEDLSAAGLSVACRIRMRLATVPNTLILRPLGRLAAIDRLRCEGSFAVMIAG